MRAILVILVILLVAVVTFSVQNPGRVDATFLVWDFQWPLLLVGLVFFAMGVLAGVTGMFPYYLKRRLEARRLRKDIRTEPRASGSVAPPELSKAGPPDPPR